MATLYLQSYDSVSSQRKIALLDNAALTKNCCHLMKSFPSQASRTGPTRAAPTSIYNLEYLGTILNQGFKS